MLALLVALQAAQPPPDIQLDANATIRDVRIRRSGEASLVVHGGPGSEVRVEAPDAQGRRRLRNVTVRVRAEARVAPPGANPIPTETPPPEPR